MTNDAPKTPPRFFIDHGVIHDRKTSKHVRFDDSCRPEDGIEECCALLNEFAAVRAAVDPIGVDGLAERLVHAALGHGNDGAFLREHFAHEIRAYLELYS